MTIACALHLPGLGTWLGGDRRTTTEAEVLSDHHLKWLVEDGWALGIAGDARAGALGQRAGLFDRLGNDPAWSIATTLRKALQADGWHTKDNAGARCFDICMLIASAGGVWAAFDCLTPIAMPAGQFVAIGSGRQLAMGAAHALRGRSPRQVVRRAVEAAIAHDTACGGEPWIHFLKG